MNDQTDSQLLRAYAENRCEAAFAELVRRHVDYVYSAARRMVVDPHLAEDVTQSVFVAFAKNACQLADRPVLSGWLHRTAQNIAAQTVRTEVRRRNREQEAVAMNELLAHEPDAGWESIAPHLDTALGELSEPDRDALLLRYFERKSAREIAQVLNVSEEAAQKRMNRAVERLREFFSKRNVTVGASGLVVLISTNAVQAAPVGLTAIFVASAANSAALSSSTASVSKGTVKLLASTHMKTIFSFISSLLAPVISLVGCYFAVRATLKYSKSAQERRSRTRFGWKIGISTVALAVFISLLNLINVPKHPWLFGVGLVSSVISYITLVLFWSFSHAKELDRIRSGGELKDSD